jgi:hypothetical protein
MAKGPSFFLSWVLFLCQRISIMLQRVQGLGILSWAIVIDLATSLLPPLHDTPPSP